MSYGNNKNVHIDVRIVILLKLIQPHQIPTVHTMIIIYMDYINYLPDFTQTGKSYVRKKEQTIERYLKLHKTFPQLYPTGIVC